MDQKAIPVSIVIAAVILAGAASYHWAEQRKYSTCKHIVESAPGNTLASHYLIDRYLDGQLEGQAAEHLNLLQRHYDARLQDCFR